jgi:hypothetical protein
VFLPDKLGQYRIHWGLQAAVDSKVPAGLGTTQGLYQIYCPLEYSEHITYCGHHFFRLYSHTAYGGIQYGDVILVAWLRDSMNEHHISSTHQAAPTGVKIGLELFKSTQENIEFAAVGLLSNASGPRSYICQAWIGS